MVAENRAAFSTTDTFEIRKRVAGMSHDIRTAINGLGGLIGFMAADSGVTPEFKEQVGKLTVSANFLKSLTEYVLEDSKTERQKDILNLKPCRAEELMRYIDVLIRPMANRKHQIFEIKLDDHLNCPILADKIRLSQIGLNLLSNAVKYTGENGKIDFYISVEERADKAFFMMKVTDNGRGIGEEFQRCMFEPYTREDRNDEQKEESSGYGLFVVRELTELMNGTISVTSKEEVGTEFIWQAQFDKVGEVRRFQKGLMHEKVLLSYQKRLQEYHRKQRACPYFQISFQERGKRQKRVLVVEDNPLNLEIAKIYLEQMNICADGALEGQKALECFGNSPEHYYDAIFMDLRLPVMDGYETSRKIRRLERVDAKEVPIIAMTADGLHSTEHYCSAAGMNACLKKPIDRKKLKSLVEAI